MPRLTSGSTTARQSVLWLALLLFSESLRFSCCRTLSDVSDFEEIAGRQGVLEELGRAPLTPAAFDEAQLRDEPDLPSAALAEALFALQPESASSSRQSRGRRRERAGAALPLRAETADSLSGVRLLSQSLNSSVDFGWEAKVLVASTQGPLSEKAFVSAHRADADGRSPSCLDTQVARSVSAGNAQVPSFARSESSGGGVLQALRGSDWEEPFDMPAASLAGAAAVNSGREKFYFYLFSVEALSDREWGDSLAFCINDGRETSEESRNEDSGNDSSSRRLLFRAQVPQACLWEEEGSGAEDQRICSARPRAKAVYTGFARGVQNTDAAREAGVGSLTCDLRVLLLLTPPSELAFDSRAEDFLRSFTRSSILALKKGALGEECGGRFDQDVLAWASVSATDASDEPPPAAAETTRLLVAGSDLHFDLNASAVAALLEEEPLQTLRLCLYTGAADSQPLSVGDVSLRDLLHPSSEQPLPAPGLSFGERWKRGVSSNYAAIDPRDAPAEVGFFVCLVLAAIVLAAFFAALRLQKQTTLEWNAFGGDSEETTLFLPEPATVAAAAGAGKTTTSRRRPFSKTEGARLRGLSEGNRLATPASTESSPRRGASEWAAERGLVDPGETQRASSEFLASGVVSCREGGTSGASPSRLVFETLWDAQLGRL